MLKRRHMFQIAGLSALAVTAGCAPDPRGASPAPAAPVATGSAALSAGQYAGATVLEKLPLDGTVGVADSALASTRIGWQAMRDVAKRGQNLVLSPSSLASALAMVAEGAAGVSLASLDEVFGLSGDARSQAMGALRQSMTGYEDLPTSVDVDAPPEAPVVHQANRVLIIAGMEVKQPFLDRVTAFHGSATDRVPLSEAKADLDAWAYRHTAGLIEKSAVKPDVDTVLVIQDALLFASKWRSEFPSDDVPLTFRTDGGADVVLEALGGRFTIPYATGDGWTAVRLAYDDQLAMDVVLPDEGTLPLALTLEQLEASRTALDAATDTSVRVVMPPLDLKVKLELQPALEAQGIDLLDLSGITDNASASQVAQQVVLQTSAKGTVGAALTEMDITTTSGGGPIVEPIPFVADRPFLARVLDVRTGWPLFLAVATDPTAPTLT